MLSKRADGVRPTWCEGVLLLHVWRGGRRKEADHWQLNSRDLLNPRWHARHGGSQYKGGSKREREGERAQRGRGREGERGGKQLCSVQSAFHDGAICSTVSREKRDSCRDSHASQGVGQSLAFLGTKFLYFTLKGSLREGLLFTIE